MHPIRKILVPVDFSPCAEEAVDHSVSAAAAVGARIELMHMRHPPSAMGWAAGQAADDEEDAV